MPQVVTQALSVTNTITETLTYGNATATGTATAATAISYPYVNSTASTGIDFHFSKSYTLLSAATTTLTLSALVDDLGRTVAFVKVKSFQVQITAKTGNDFLTVGAAAANPWVGFLSGTTPATLIRRYFLTVADDTTGYAVTASVSDQLKIVNSGSSSMTFVVTITGTSV